MNSVTIHWFRRDLRLHDNRALFEALQTGGPVLPLFIFDRQILDDLIDPTDARVSFIHQQITAIRDNLAQHGKTLLVEYGNPPDIWESILKKMSVRAVFTNRDYEPYAKDRDQRIAQILENKGIPFNSFKDHVIFEGGEIVKKDGTPYTVFTPFSKQWNLRLSSREDALMHYRSEERIQAFLDGAPGQIPTLSDLGFEETKASIPPKIVTKGLIKRYGEQRNFPALQGTTRLGVHFRFGTISVREKLKAALPLSPVFVNELIWRDFYSMILDQFPRVVNQPFRHKYKAIPWRNDQDEFEAWCEGQTGYPLVDAGMRELNQTGYMHNRVRMVTASFLTKHLLIDWRLGEAYFAKKLLDYDLASNNGGWQWAAGCGTDAAPYFRIFNPISQQQKFDKEMRYIKKWVPEVQSKDYPAPIVDHKFARARCLETYKMAISDQ